ncbi:MAG: hypothetical protein GXN94_04390 [Aquificae bacterium]|nr:hypothetical protein [Aquificota bacterium]
MEICGLSFPEKNFNRHLTKRIKYGQINSRKEYIEKIKDTLKNADRFYLLRELSDCKDKIVFFNSKNNWTVIVLVEENRILTSFLLDEAENILTYYKNKDYYLYLIGDCTKGSLVEVKKDENSQYANFIRKVQDRC